MATDILLLAAGLVALFAGGDMLVRGAVGIARRAGLSPMVIGLTLVGFGTSTPELVTSVQAALAGAPGIAIGNVVGSNIANILLILGLGAVLAPIAVTRGALVRDGGVLAAASLAALAAMAAGTIGRVPGAAFVIALVGYVVLTLWQERRHRTEAAAIYAAEADSVVATARSAGPAAIQVVAGLVLTLLGARLLVGGAIGLAATAGVPDTVIGLTIVAVGTSLPELVTTAAAVRQGRGDVALGNVIGSNIFNLLGILGATALIRPLAVPEEILRFDIWAMLAATAALVIVARTGWRIERAEGAGLLAAYAAYLGVLMLLAAGTSAG
jgi:cation:H+ antiporter